MAINRRPVGYSIIRPTGPPPSTCLPKSASRSRPYGVILPAAPPATSDSVTVAATVLRRLTDGDGDGRGRADCPECPPARRPSLSTAAALPVGRARAAARFSGPHPPVTNSDPRGHAGCGAPRGQPGDRITTTHTLTQRSCDTQKQI